jgi:hypothetical protein
MSVEFVLPNLPGGYCPSRVTAGEYHYAANYHSGLIWADDDLVDGDTIQRNWNVLFSHVNGKLNGTDFDASSGTLSETTWVADVEGAGVKRWPTLRQRHSHDGMDSALLGEGVINKTAINAGGHGMLRFPSIHMMAGVLHTVGIVDMTNPDSSSTFKIDIPVPYNYKTFRRTGSRMISHPETSDTVAHGSQRTLLAVNPTGTNEVGGAAKNEFRVPCCMTMYDLLSSVELVVSNTFVHNPFSALISPGWSVSSITYVAVVPNWF